MLVQYATARIGAILVTINPAYRSSELEYVLNQSQVSVLVAVESFLTGDYRSMIDEVWDRVAWVQLRDGATTTDEDIKEFCRGRIAHFKVPRYVKFTDSFPMTITGRIQKFKMRETSVEELGLGEAASVRSA